MDETYLSKLAAGPEAKYRQLEREIMADIVRRIRKTQGISSTADWQIQRLKILGNSDADIQRIIDKTVGEISCDELYADVVAKYYVRDRKLYQQSGEAELQPDPEEIGTITAALVRQSDAELYNISRSLAFVIDGRLTPLTAIYNSYIDQAVVGVITGAFSYNTMLRKTVNQLTGSGLRSIDYESGTSNRVDVAARRAIMTGLNQVAGKAADITAERLGVDTFEVSWHAGARPEHAAWQGRIYTRQQLATVCGLGSGGGLLGWNCRHTYMAFVPGISQRAYTDEWLELQAQKEAEEIPFRGKSYNAYEATQRQRQMETTMRAQREKVALLQEGGADPDEIMLSKAKYQTQIDEYVQFSKKMGLPQQRERIYYDTFGKLSTNSKKQNAAFNPLMIKNATRDVKQYKSYKNILGKDIGTLAEFGQMKYTDKKKWEYIQGLKRYLVKYPTSNKKIYDASEELKSLGIKNGVLLPAVKKQAFILPSGKREPYHIMNRMLERNITDNDLYSYMNEAKVMFVQWNGNRQLFASKKGFCLIAKQDDDWVYKTAWSSIDFDEESEMILEVLENVGL